MDNEKYENLMLPRILPDGGKIIEDILTRQPDVKSTWIIQVSLLAFASKGKKNILEEIVVQDVIG